MREFAFGSDEQYSMLRDTLEDNLCHVFETCIMPNGCITRVGRIGFEKEASTGAYAIYIDKGITCSNQLAPPLFIEWLSVGTLRFLDFTDVKDFFYSLRDLF